jgi:hypothetical protein
MDKKKTPRTSRSRKPASASPTKALAIGRKIAEDVLRVRDAALERRRRALGAAPPAVRARGGTALRFEAAGAPARGVLVAEGDSWFNYPWHDVLSMLEDQHGYDVESVAHAGDPVEAMAYTGGQLAKFTSTIEKLLRRQVVPAAILLSGGGNDVAGDELAMLLNHAASPHPGLNEDVVRGVIDVRVKDAIVSVLSAVTAICRARIGRALPIIIHGYDHPVPDGRGILGGWGPLPGPWLQPSLREKGFDDLDANIAMMAALIDRFNRMLSSVPGISGFDHVRYLDLRGTLSNAANYKTWWANELHPSERGFAAVADKFAALL